MRKLVLILGLLLLGGNWAAAQQEASPPGGMSKLAAYSIFSEDYENEQYQNALKFGRWIWQNMPRKLEGHPGFRLERSMRYLINSYTALAEQAEDPSIREAYVDSAGTLYEKVFNEMEDDEIDRFQWHLRYGRFMHQYSDYIDDALNRAAEQYRQAMEMNREKLIGQADGYYIQFILQQMVAQEQKEEALQLMDELEPEVSPSMTDYFDKQREKLFDTPEERIAFLKEKLSEDPENLDLLHELRSIYEDQDNVEEVRRINQKLYELNPTFENIRAMAELARSNANYEQAVRYLTEAIEKAPSDGLQYQMLMQLSQTHLNNDSLEEARTYARKAADLDSEAAEPYFRIGSIYARAVSNCSQGRDLTRQDRAVYWLVVDYMQRAKEVNPAVANRADSQIKTYSDAAPQREDVFFTDEWEEGESIRIDGSLNECYSWINETTTIPTFD